MERLLRIFEISDCIQNFLVAKDLKGVQPKELMGELVEKGFFLKDYNEGKPLRSLLRDLDLENKLYLMPQVIVERKDKYNYWYFTSVNDKDFALAIHKIYKLLSNLIENDRYYSWRHCFNAFNSLKNGNNENELALHLGFFLASWGMYRGSAGLLQKDYNVHVGAVRILKKYHMLRCEGGNDIDTKDKNQILEVIGKLKEYYGDLTYINSKNEKKYLSPTDTLISKILLGTLACSPAYDTYFLGGVSLHDQQFKDLEKESLNSLLEFAKNKETELRHIQHVIQEEFHVFYPIMKIIDLYFWNEGYLNSL